MSVSVDRIPEWRRWYVLGVLFVVALFNYIDRSILSILQIPIKDELGLSDTQLGALTGLAFALFYTTLGLPVARLADRTSRKIILAIAVTLWSLMTALCAAAGGFLSLFLARMGVALGEGAGAPTSHALVAEYFPLGRRSTALAIWGLAIPLGGMLGVGVAGFLHDAVGWRNAFAILGLSGIALGPLVLFTVGEPSRAARAQATEAPPTAPPKIGETLRILWNLKTFRYMSLGGLLHAFASHTIAAWNAPFYVRAYGMNIGEVALYLALMAGIGGALGIYVGGAVADRGGRKDARWYAWVPAAASMLIVPVGAVQYLTTSLPLSLLLGGVSLFLANAHTGPVVGTVQSLAPPRIRAFASAMLVLVANGLSLALGPLFAGKVSDILIAQGMTTRSLGYAIAATLVFPLLGSLVYLRAARSVRGELATANGAAQH